MSMNFNERVRIVWKEKRPDIKSVRNLEEHIGLSNGTIASWKKSSPSQTKIEQVANFFGVSVDYLLGNTDDMHANKSTPTDTDLEEMLDGAVAYGGKPMSDNDRTILKGMLKAYFDNKED